MSEFYEFNFIVEKKKVTRDIVSQLVNLFYEINNLKKTEQGFEQNVEGLLNFGNGGGASFSLNPKDPASFELSAEFFSNDFADFSRIPEPLLVFSISILDKDYLLNEQKRERFLQCAKQVYTLLHPIYGVIGHSLEVGFYGYEPKEIETTIHRHMFFGPERVKQIGKEAFKSTLPAEVEALDDGGFYLYLPIEKERNIESFRTVAKQLGLKLVFDDTKTNKRIVEDYTKEGGKG